MCYYPLPCYDEQQLYPSWDVNSCVGDVWLFSTSSDAWIINEIFCGIRYGVFQVSNDMHENDNFKKKKKIKRRMRFFVEEMLSGVLSKRPNIKRTGCGWQVANARSSVLAVLRDNMYASHTQDMNVLRPRAWRGGDRVPDWTIGLHFFTLKTRTAMQPPYA